MILFTGGGGVSQHALQQVSGGSAPGGCLLLGGSAPRGGVCS